MGHALTPTGSLCAQARGLSQRRPPQEYLPSCRHSSCCLLEDSWTKLSACSHVDPWPKALNGIQTWGPQGPSLTTRHQPSPGSSAPASQQKPCPPSRCQNPAQIPVRVAEWPKVPSSQVKYSAPAGDKGVSCPLCQLRAQGKGEPRESFLGLPGPASICL